jgi:hypothetical protein
MVPLPKWPSMELTTLCNAFAWVHPNRSVSGRARGGVARALHETGRALPRVSPAPL